MDDVPITIMFVVPVGVLGTVGGEEVPLPLPPQDARVAAAAIVKIPTIAKRLRTRVPAQTIPNAPKLTSAREISARRECGTAGCAKAIAVPEVLITRLEVTGELPAVSVAGVNVQVASAGTLLHARETCELKPAVPEIAIVIVAD